MADNSGFSKSPASFARVRAKKAGLECKPDKLIVKPFEKEMTKLIGHQTIVKKEELMLVDLVLSKGQQTHKLDIMENKVLDQINKKKLVAAAISKDIDHLKEMSEM